MLVTAAVLPGPPALFAELMGSAAHELDELRQTIDEVLDRVVSELFAASADSPPSASGSGPRPPPIQLVIVGPGPSGEFDVGGPVSFAGFGLDVSIPALIRGRRGDGELPTPLMVARYLASRDIAAHPEHADLWAAARWLTTNRGDGSTLGEELRAGSTAVALVLVADGAACHGPKAPRAQDDRAQPYDDGVRDALASGRPGQLARIDAELGDELGATGPAVWPVLVAAAGRDFIGEVHWSGAPYGVGWVVATWRRPATVGVSTSSA